jgi:hypothetical protein
MRREMEKVLTKSLHVTRVVFVEAGKHVRPIELRATLREEIATMKDQVDVILLGYGACQSLEGIEKEFDIPIIHPEENDCIAILFTQERYNAEIAKNPGTWFMTPGWAELGPDMILNELGLLHHAEKRGINKKEVIKELFDGYSRGLYIDTGVDESGMFEEMAEMSCVLFNLKLEKVVSDSTVLEDSLEKAEGLLMRDKSNRTIRIEKYSVAKKDNKK